MLPEDRQMILDELTEAVNRDHSDPTHRQIAIAVAITAIELTDDAAMQTMLHFAAKFEELASQNPRLSPGLRAAAKSIRTFVEGEFAGQT